MAGTEIIVLIVSAPCFFSGRTPHASLPLNPSPRDIIYFPKTSRFIPRLPPIISRTPSRLLLPLSPKTMYFFFFFVVCGLQTFCDRSFQSASPAGTRSRTRPRPACGRTSAASPPACTRAAGYARPCSRPLPPPQAVRRRCRRQRRHYRRRRGASRRGFGRTRRGRGTAQRRRRKEGSEKRERARGSQIMAALLTPWVCCFFRIFGGHNAGCRRGGERAQDLTNVV